MIPENASVDALLIKCEQLTEENARLTDALRVLRGEIGMSDFGGNNEADSKLRQHCIALEAENVRLMAVREMYELRNLELATRCGELEAALKTWRMLFTQAELLERVELDTKLTASFSTPK